MFQVKDSGLRDLRSADTDKKSTQNLSGKPWSKETTKKTESYTGR
jgi:hypothetical protein